MATETAIADKPCPVILTIGISRLPFDRDAILEPADTFFFLNRIGIGGCVLPATCGYNSHRAPKLVAEDTVHDGEDRGIRANPE